MTKDEFAVLLDEHVKDYAAVDGYVMRRLPREEWIARSCGNDAIMLGAWVHRGATYWKKILLVDLTEYILGFPGA